MIIKTLKTVFFIIAVASFSFGSAQEKQKIKKGKSEKNFQNVDANADGAITFSEFKANFLRDESKSAQLEEKFKILDADKNGSLNRDEFKVAFGDRSSNQKMKAKEMKKKKG